MVGVRSSAYGRSTLEGGSVQAPDLPVHIDWLDFPRRLRDFAHFHGAAGTADNLENQAVWRDNFKCTGLVPENFRRIIHSYGALKR